MKKIILPFFLLLFLLLIFSITLLSTIGYETDRFNNLVTKKIEENNKDISIKLNQIKFKFDIKNLSLFLETQSPLLDYKSLNIPIKKVKVYLEFLSLIKSKSKIEKIDIVSNEIDITEFKKIIVKTKPSNLNSLIVNKVNGGKLSTELELYFKEDFKLDNFIAKGKVKKMNVVITDKFTLSNANFDFFFDYTDVLIQNIIGELEGLSLKAGSLQLNRDNKITLKSDFITESNFNKTNIENYLEYFGNSNLINKNTILSSNLNHNLNVSFDNTYKVIAYNYSNRGKINNFSTKLSQPASNNFLSDKITKISIKDADFNYKNSLKKKHNINSSGSYSFNDDNFNNYEISGNFLKENLNFNINFNFSQKFKIDFINYTKSKDIEAKIYIDLNKNKNKINFKTLKISENKNYIDIKNLIFDNSNVISFERIDIKTFKQNKLNNDFVIKLGKKIDIKGSRYDAQNLNKFFNNKTNNNILKKINKDIDIQLENIQTPLSKKLKNFRLLGTIKKGAFVKISSKGDFGQDKFLDISLKSDKENKKKYLEIYSDLPQPLLSEYSFFKGLTGGTLTFSSIFEDDLSNSKLIIENFKIVNAPGVVKLLSLADFGGLADLAEGDGLSFEKLEINMSNKKGFLKLNELFAIGPSISVLMEGYKDTNDLTSLRGTLVPAKNLNKLLSKIPVIGEIIIPKEIGEGLFGVSFKMKGPPGKIKTTINPIKTLTPRFITKALNKSKSK